jgi:hypothetical protein
MARTRMYLVMAGLEACKTGAEKAAIHYLSQCIGIDESNGSRCWKSNDSDFSSFEHESGMIHLHLGRAYYGIAGFDQSKIHINQGLVKLGLSSPTSAAVAGFSILKWAASSLFSKTKNSSKIEKRFGEKEVSMKVFSLVSKAYGDLASAYVLSDDSTLYFVFAVSKMHSLACTVNDTASICTACAWLTTIFVILGQPKIANHYSKQASNIADQFGTVQCMAPARYAKMWVAGGAGHIEEALYVAISAKEYFEKVGDLRRSREADSILVSFLANLGRFRENLILSEKGIAHAEEAGDQDTVTTNLLLKAGALMFLGEFEDGIALTRVAYKITLSGNTHRKNTDSGVVATARCMQGEFYSAIDAVIGSCAGGGNLTQYIWSHLDVRFISIALWEIENYIRGKKVPEKNESKERKKELTDCRETLRVRAVKLAKKFRVAVPVLNFHDFLKGFSDFEEFQKVEMEAIQAQETEIVTQVIITKFYFVLAKAAYEERARRGIRSKAGGSMSKAAKGNNVAPEGRTVISERRTVRGVAEPGEIFVVKLKGENLRLMREAIKKFSEIEFGMFSDITEKVVALDDGTNVLIRWGKVEEEEETARDNAGR